MGVPFRTLAAQLEQQILKYKSELSQLEGSLSDVGYSEEYETRTLAKVTLYKKVIKDLEILLGT